MKRIIAGLLCATMLFSMDGYRSVSYAAGPDTYYSLEAGSESTIEEDEATYLSTTNPEENDNEEAEAADEASTEATSATEASTAASTEDAADEASSEASEAADAADAASSEASEDAADEASSLDSAVETEELGEGRVTANLMSTPSKASTCFGVDENGVLFLKEGETIPDPAIVPAEAKTIPNNIFKGNHTCSEVRFLENNQLTTIEAGAFEDSDITTIKIPKGVTEIKEATFKNASSLESVTFEAKEAGSRTNNITKIGKEAFSGTIIRSLNITNVEEIGNGAFSGCTSLESVSVNKLKVIGSSAFNGCLALTDFSFPNSVYEIGDKAFAGCIKLSSVELAGKKDENGNVTSKRASLTIGNNCFQNDTNLVFVELPDCMEVIPIRAFSGCTKLSRVTIGENTLRIENNAFENCTALDTIVFPSVEVFGAKAFDGCSALKTIYIDCKKQGIKIDKDAFPLKSGVTMHGYTEEVQDYAESKGYTFVLEVSTYSLSASLTGGSGSYYFTSASSNGKRVSQAIAGEKVMLTVLPAEGYEVSGISIKEARPISDSSIELTEYTAEKQVFRFTMPYGNEKVNITLAKRGETVRGKLSSSVKGINCSDPEPVEGSYYFDVSGRKARVVVKQDGAETSSWLWTYSSSDPKVATVSSQGTIVTTGKGKATITATLKSDAKKKTSVSIRVGGKATVGSIELSVPSTVSRAKVFEENYGNTSDEKITVVEYKKTSLETGNKTFNVSIKAFPEGTLEDNDLVVKSKWTSTDKSIASVAASSNTNSNTITVNKGAVGETLITVSVLNDGQKTPSEENTKSFIVRVVDATPRLNNGNITVDSNSTIGTALEIRTVYGYKISGNLKLVTKVKDSKGVIDYKNFDDLMIYPYGDIYYIANDNPSSPFEKTYSGSTQLYIKGNFVGENNKKGDDFIIPIPKVTVTNKALNPTLKNTGKINLFFNSTASSADAGKVTVTQSLGNLAVNDVKLVSAANFKKAGSEYPDSFAANFDIKNIDNKTFEITRSASEEMAKVNGKNVTSGYIYIYYDGYAEPVKKPISVATIDTAPDYVLDITSATASLYSENQKYELQLVDKKTKKNAVKLNALDTSISESGNIVGLGLNASTTDNLFKDLDIQTAKETNKITLKVDGTPRKGTANIYVRLTTWSRPLTYKFNLNVSNALPTVKLSSGSATLNKTYAGQSATIKLTQNQKEAELCDVEITYAGSTKLEAEAALLKIEHDKDSVVVSLPKDGKVAKGTYKYKIVPKVTYDGAGTIPTKVQYFNVVVTETNPSIKLSNSVFKLNAETPGYEEVERTYTIGNLPTGVTGTIENGDVSIETSKDGEADRDRAVINPVGTAPAFESIATLVFEGGVATVKLKKEKTVTAYSGKTFKYTVKNLRVKCDSEDSAVIPDFTISVQLNKAKPSIKIAQKGTINPIDKTSKVALTATVSNIESDIESISIVELDDNNIRYRDENHNTYSKHFAVEIDKDNGKVAYIKAKDGQVLTNNKKYKLEVTYTLKSNPGKKLDPIVVTIVPKQSLPQITTDKTEATIYARQTDKDGNPDRKVKVKITQKATNMQVTMTTPVLPEGSNSEAIRKAFKVTDFNPETGEMTFELVNPSVLVQNSTYTLNFETTYKDQAQKTAGNKFSVKVSIKK